jgi:hypothetical protein
VYIKHPEGETDKQANEEQFKGNNSDPKYEYWRVPFIRHSALYDIAAQRTT